MKVEQGQKNEVAILKIMGWIRPNEIEDFSKAIKKSGLVKIVLDLSKFEYLNSSGLGRMVALHSSFDLKGGGIKIANASDKIKRLFRITHLDEIIEFYDSVDAAVRFFQKEAQKENKTGSKS